MSNASQNEQLLNALVDGELSGSEREDALRLIASDPQYAQYVNELKAQREQFSSLPAFSLPDDFTARVLKAAIRESESGGSGPAVRNAPDEQDLHLSTPPSGQLQEAGRGTQSPAPEQGRQRSHLGAIVAIASLAAMLLFALVVVPRTIQPAGETTAAVPSEAADGAVADSIDEEPEENAASGDAGPADGSVRDDDVDRFLNPKQDGGAAGFAPPTAAAVPPGGATAVGNSPGGIAATATPSSDLPSGGMSEEERLRLLEQGLHNGITGSGNGINSQFDGQQAGGESPSMQVADAGNADASDIEDLADEGQGDATPALDLIAGAELMQLQRGSAGMNRISPRLHNELVIFELEDRDQLAGVEQVFWDNSIQTSLPGQQQAENTYQLQNQILANTRQNPDGFEAVCVFASPSQMKNAIQELSEQTSVKSYQFPTEVLAFSAQPASVNADPVPLENSTADGSAGGGRPFRGGGAVGGAGGAGLGGGGGMIGDDVQMQSYPDAGSQGFAYQIPRNIDIVRGQNPAARENEANKLNTFNNSVATSEPVDEARQEYLRLRAQEMRSRGVSPEERRLLADLEQRAAEREQNGQMAQQEFDAAPEQNAVTGHSEGLAPYDQLELESAADELQPYYILFSFSSEKDGQQAEPAVEGDGG